MPWYPEPPCQDEERGWTSDRQPGAHLYIVSYAHWPEETTGTFHYRHIQPYEQNFILEKLIPLRMKQSSLQCSSTQHRNKVAKRVKNAPPSQTLQAAKNRHSPWSSHRQHFSTLVLGPINKRWFMTTGFVKVYQEIKNVRMCIPENSGFSWQCP